MKGLELAETMDFGRQTGEMPFEEGEFKLHTNFMSGTKFTYFCTKLRM